MGYHPATLVCRVAKGYYSFHHGAFGGAGGWAPFVNAPWNKSGPQWCYASTVCILPVIIPHMKQASSLATAVTALLCGFLLRNTSVKYLFLNRSLALSAYAITSAVFPS